ncbi:23S rRNA (adenine(2503)-C(2))-methyltransferase RlmN [Candidatus Riesia pediculicola]|uniref:Dual-specificity RNA methyltransferase RlmN n=1 Tax=Riesia pediculicola (strain USDA) TaxID=515618 RepID=D4G8C9_RIEPU|nr:23S rRNA (adenine(2503)-C(2))-methyltransferase RlmN [Candidatus Riesia pediculicola]ADD79660.1 radical SAM enzyme, Cfr family [Candidatus Riesia pediculicola USDA]QOJ86452.1 23S rRNA (adenine(2503)-C(2))-methyltransferase RlmN [Candidatus Riesia pediculicola]
MSNKLNLLQYDILKVRKIFKDIGENTFRADQLTDWIYRHYCDNFQSMTNFSRDLRKKMESFFQILPPRIQEKKISLDGTIKWRMRTDSEETIETVFIPEGRRKTLCISSQIGCPLKCRFCFVSKKKFRRNLKISEIVGQVWIAGKILRKEISSVFSKKRNHLLPFTNIVIMGTGEPLLNFRNILSSIRIITSSHGFNFPEKKIVLSTAGVSPAIEKLLENTQIKLAISLHAPNNKIRDRIMPINKKYDIQSILDSIQKFQNHSNIFQRITIEYIMLRGINDEVQDAYQLADILKNIPVKINLIPFNSTAGIPYKRSNLLHIQQFSEILKKFRFVTTVRKTKGGDIQASCGQLSYEN